MNEFEGFGADESLSEGDQSQTGITTSQPEGVGRISEDARGPEAQRSSSPSESDARRRAIEYGTRLGADAADQLRETGAVKEERVRRAQMYAAWEFDGKPQGRGEFYRKEFKVRSPQVTESLDRALTPRLLKKK